MCIGTAGRDEAVEEDVRPADRNINMMRDDDKGGNWRRNGRLVAGTAIANEIFMEGRAGYEPIEVSDVFQAETMLLLTIDFHRLRLRCAALNGTRSYDIVNTTPPNTEKWPRKFHDENNGCGESYEKKCATNYSIITNNNWNDAYNMQLTKHDTNDDVDTMQLHFNGRVAYMH